MQTELKIDTTHPVRTLLGCVLAACLLLIGCNAGPKASSAITIKIATYEWPGSYWIDVAWDKGWFAEAGLKVERINVDRKYFASLDDLAAGRLDVMGFSQFDLVRHVADGHDLVGIAALDYSIGAEALVARPGMHSLRDLKGKRIALTRNTYLEYLLSIAAEREGLDLADVTLVDSGADQSVADFKAGKIDALFVWDPYVTEALDAGGVSLFSTADFPGLTYTVLTLRRDFIEAHRPEVTALMLVWDRAERYVREHPAQSSQIAARLLQEEPKGTLDLLRTVRVLDLTDNGRAFSYAAGFESLHGSWRRMNDFMLERGLVTQRVDSTSHLDTDFIRLLE